MLKGAIFDLGGTLIHLTMTWEQIRETRIKAIYETLRERHVRVDLSDLRREYLRQHEEESEYVNRTLEEIEMRSSLSNLLGRMEIESSQRPEMEKLVKRYFSAEIDSWAPFPGVTEMLQQVHDLGLRLGVLSNARSDWAVKEIMRRLRLTEFFDEILTSAAIGIRKPRPEPFKKMLELLELKASDTVMIGNSMEADVAGAKPLGFKMIRVVLGDSTDEIPIKHDVTIEPDFTVSAVSDIVAAIKKLAAS